MDSLNSLHYLSLILDQKRRNETEKQYAILDIPQEMESCRHLVLQSVDGACPNEMRRSKHEISWSQGDLTTQTVMKARGKS